MTMKLKDIQHKISGTSTSYANHYKGIPIFSAHGIHERIFESFLKNSLSKDSSILILGAGAGAFDKRLLDHGYNNVTSTEFIPENYMVQGTKFFAFDLNEDFSVLGKFDAIIALEIIEHLENHFHFIRCVKNCLNEEGVFYLSSPNVESTFSRAKFFILGRLHFFSKEELYHTGHINPVFEHILKFILDQNNLGIEEIFTNGNVWSQVWRQTNSFLLKATYGLFFILSLGMKNRNNNDINLYKIVST